MAYIAHFREKTKEDQLLKDHLIAVAKLCGSFGEQLGLYHCCYLTGLLHDMGKYSDEFQKYIRLAKENPAEAVRGSVDHSTAGGKLIAALCAEDSGNTYKRVVAEIVGNAVISHHSGLGLQNFVNPGDNEKKPSDYLYRVNEKEVEEYSEAKERFFAEVHNIEELDELIEKAVNEVKGLVASSAKQTDMFFLAKFVYSCLIDADRTDTRIFEEESNEIGKDNTVDLLNKYQQKFEAYNQGFEDVNKTPINKLRMDMSNQCFEFANRETGIYTLSIPTGGGKTLSSLRFALNHAKKHGKQRIIYIVPFTTIIEQNASVVKEILQDNENIIEHHSNIFNEEPFDPKNKDDLIEKDEILEKKQELLRDNWDAPIIFTTMVQFLEAVYGRGTRKVRRFHRLIDAVLIFDEVQSVPIHCMYMFVDFINFASKIGKTTNVLCTATQPGFEHLCEKRRLMLKEDSEMVDNLSMVQESFKRVEIIDQTDKGKNFWDLDEVADFSRNVLREQDSLLIILNTKSAVRELYKKFDLNDYELFHLSTSMCAAHRKEILKNIKKALKDGSKKVLCITTQLIEAGVDISFQNVIRSMAGLDSIAQAAGRCNRSGEFESGKVYLINLKDGIEKLDNLPTIKNGKKTTKGILRDGYTDYELLTRQAMDSYFKEHYIRFNHEMKYLVTGEDFTLRSLIDYQKDEKNEINSLWGDEGRLKVQPQVTFRSSAKTIAKHFKVIDSPTKSVIVPYDEKGKELIAILNGNISLNELNLVLKEAQQYTVNLFKWEFDRMCENQGIYSIGNSNNYNEEIYAVQSNFYDDKYGLDIEGESDMENLVNMF